MNLLQTLSDNENPRSLAAHFRRKRFELFRPLLTRRNQLITVIDIGGTESFWLQAGIDTLPHIEVTLVNIFPFSTSHPRLHAVVADGRDLSQFADKHFDIAFSNSVIEHLPSSQDQMLFANELQRVAAHYFVQTPNYFFPLEPHFLFPGFQFLPFALRVWLLQQRKLGWVDKVPDKAGAERVISHVRLLKDRELQALFPQARILREKLLGLTKSLIATNYVS